MKGRSEQYFDCRVPSDHSGVSVVRMKKIRLYDFLRIFSCHLPVPGRQEISVLPPLHQAELTVTPRSGREEMEEETDDTQKGDDPSVIYLGYGNISGGFDAEDPLETERAYGSVDGQRIRQDEGAHSSASVAGPPVGEGDG